MLSDEHLLKHILEIHGRYLSAGDHGGGGHSGLTLGIYCAITGEAPERVGRIMSNLKWADAPSWAHSRNFPYHNGGKPEWYFRPYT